VFLQERLHLSPLQTGLTVLPPAAMFLVVGGWGASRLVNRVGMRKALILAATFITLGSVLLIPISVEAGYLGILPGSTIWALGASIGFPALAMAGLSGAKPGEEGLASGLIQTSQRLGFPLGLAILLTLGSAFDPGLGVVAFRYAFIGSAILGALGLAVAVLLGRGSRSQEASSGEQVLPEVFP
jgi:MFS family permease